MRYKDLEILNSQANTFLESAIQSDIDANFERILRDISDTILPLLSHQILNAPQIRQLICLGTTALLGQDETSKIAKRCILFIHKKIKTAVGEQIIHLINVSIDQFQSRSGRVALLLLPPEFKKEIDHYVNDLEHLIDISNFRISKKIWANLEKLTINPGLSVALKSSLKGLLDTAKGSGPDSELALKALTYLHLEEDLIDDNLGLFGLADDIYVIEETASKLGLLKFGQSFLLDLRSNNFYSDNFFFEEDGQLLPLGPQTRAILKSIKYLRANNNHKVNIVLPEIGPTTLLYIIDSYLSQLVPNEVNSEYPQIGDEIYFKVINGYIGAIFKGFREVGNEKLPMLGFSDDKFGTMVSISSNILKSAIRTVPEGARVFRNQKAFEEKRNDDAAFTPSHVYLNFNSEREELIVLAQKNQFLRYFSLIKPYGENFENILRITYLKSNGAEEIIGYGPINITLCSDETTAKNKIDELIFQEKKIDLVLENSRNAGGLISALSDWHLDKISTVTCFTTVRDIDTASELEERNISILHLDEAFIDLDKKASAKKSVIRSFEHYLTDISRGPKFESAFLLLPTTDEFHYLFRELFLRHDELPFDLKYRLSYFREQFIWNPLPLTSESIEFAINLRTQIFEELNFSRDELSDLMIELLTEKWEVLLEEKHSRNIEKILIDHENDDYSIFARSKIEKVRLNEHMKKSGFGARQIIDNPFDNVSSQISSLIVPVLPSKYKRLMLHNMHVTGKVLLNFSIYETEIFNRTENLKLKQNEFLFRKSANNFNEFNSVQRKLNKNYLGQNIKKEQPVDIDLEDLQASRIKNTIESNFGDERYDTSAFPILLSEKQEYVLLPGNAKILTYDIYVKSFQFRNVARISEGDLILIRSDNTTDFIDDIANLVVADFDSTSKAAITWREALSGFVTHRGYSAAALQRFLAENTPIVKTSTTIRNWLSDCTMIAPDDYEVVIPEIADLLAKFGYNFDATSTIEAIKNVYNARRIARDALNNYFMQTIFDDVYDNKAISVDLQNYSVNFFVKEIAAIAPIITVPYVSTWKINKLS